MKKIALSALALISFGVQADELSTFKDVADAVSLGKQITFVINFKQCTSEMPLGSSTVSISPNAVAVIGNNRITASDRHFTLDDPMARGTPLYDFSKYNINSEGGASIKITVMNASNYEKLASYLINCELGEGFKVFG